MFDFLKRKRPKKAHKPLIESDSIAPRSTRQRSNIHRELIRVVLKDTLRLHCIPFGWLGCEVTTITRSTGVDELHIWLVMMSWNEPLLRYAPVLQRELLLGLDRFDPSVDHSKYIVSWRFSPTCGNPYTQMPDPEVWLPSGPPQVKDEPICIMDRRQARDPASAPALTASLLEPYDRPPNFQATDILPLR
jgi:hypothetical protein